MEASQGPRMKFMHQQRQSIDSDEKSGVMILKITTALTLNLHLNANESKSQGMPESKPQSPRPLGVAHAKRMRYICNFTLKEYECSQRHFADCAEMAQTFVQSILLHITTPFASDGQRTRHAVNNNPTSVGQRRTACQPTADSFWWTEGAASCQQLLRLTAASCSRPRT